MLRLGLTLHCLHWGSCFFTLKSFWSVDLTWELTTYHMHNSMFHSTDGIVWQYQGNIFITWHRVVKWIFLKHSFRIKISVKSSPTTLRCQSMKMTPEHIMLCIKLQFTFSWFSTNNQKRILFFLTLLYFTFTLLKLTINLHI